MKTLIFALLFSTFSIVYTMKDDTIDDQIENFFRKSEYEKTLNKLEKEAQLEVVDSSEFINKVGSLAETALRLYNEEEIGKKHEFRMRIGLDNPQTEYKTTSDEYTILLQLLYKVNRKAITLKNEKLLGQETITNINKAQTNLQSFVQKIEQCNGANDLKIITAALESRFFAPTIISLTSFARVKFFEKFVNNYDYIDYKDDSLTEEFFSQCSKNYPIMQQIYANCNQNVFNKIFNISKYETTLNTLKEKVMSKETDLVKFINEVDPLIDSASLFYDEEKIGEKHELRIILNNFRIEYKTMHDAHTILRYLSCIINDRAKSLKNKSLLNEKIIANGYNVLLKSQSLNEKIEKNNYQKDLKIIESELKFRDCAKKNIQKLYDARIKSFKDFLNTYCEEMNYKPKGEVN